MRTRLDDPSDMRILVATTTGFHLRHLAGCLIGMGINTTFLTYLPDFKIRQFGIPKSNSKSLFWRLQPWSSAALFRYSRSIVQSSTEKMLELTDNEIAKAMPPCDVFIGLSAMAVKCALRARNEYGAKIIIDRGARHVLSQNDLISHQSNSALTKYYIDRELASYKTADYIALPSGHAVQSFLDVGYPPTKLFKNAYGVDFNLFHPQATPRPPLNLVFVGAWSYQKGADILSTALDRIPDCRLTHVGTRVNVPYPTSDRFRAVGYIPPHQLSRILGDHHVLVLPSRQDGFGMVIQEALACGLRVVASNMTGAPDVLESISRKDVVEIIKPGCVDSLVAGIKSVEAGALSESSPRLLLTDQDKESLGWSAYAQRYVQFMSKIMQTSADVKA